MVILVSLFTPIFSDNAAISSGILADRPCLIPSPKDPPAMVILVSLFTPIFSDNAAISSGILADRPCLIFVPHACILHDGGAFASDGKISAVLLLSLASPSILNIRATSSAREW
eukprot:CAMPEP_0201987326 /NCGR_PEP_ID=MMETSP0904-20121228/91740_1 /ASSEMBLY_ACC=CAM_ASM_000553 /TAXON_ID=420261 /ORGANISM="Thalassiosira antarctica, Strain CCMP982" /LENGTH=113 /DNA_ID=CAMNT_0048541431 /DNA_START=332 /DNA_END=673 /DNA_ORIENTATION=+